MCHLERQECSEKAEAAGAAAAQDLGTAAGGGSPDNLAALFAAGINGPPGDDVEVDLSAPKKGKAKYSDLTARRIKEVQEGVDKGKIRLDPANWKWRHSEHEHGYRPSTHRRLGPADHLPRPGVLLLALHGRHHAREELVQGRAPGLRGRRHVLVAHH